ncbi:MAG TPA: hypothetical protein VH518_20240 [Tepidisphaeraceae bacterium]|jgi:hypothetical protein
MRQIALALLAFLSCLSPAVAEDNRLVVHEWGTFTSLQDENGRALGAINQDVEPLPDFVKNLFPADTSSPFSKGVAVSPDVTMRLETPVVYFHPPQGSKPLDVSFSAEFHGGLLTQFYPDATFTPPSEKIGRDTVGKLQWRNLTVGTGKPGPATTSRVWLAPRKVNAADVTAANGDNERYLFYRGVGHLDSPLRVQHDGGTLRISGHSNILCDLLESLRVDDLWYLDVAADGRSAFRKLPPTLITQSESMRLNCSTAEAFEPSEYANDGITKLRAEMKPALMKAGLFDDEAEAMLNTWEEAYFKSPGTRVLYIVPRIWVDSILPIKLSVDAQIERVMVGRIDLVTPKQRQLARQYLAISDRGIANAQLLYKQLGRFAGPIIDDENTRAVKN